MTGLLRSSRVGPIGATFPSLISRSSPAAIAWRSGPAQKFSPAPVRTATLAVWSLSNATKASLRAWAVAKSIAFRTSGRLRVTIRTSASRVVSTVAMSLGIPCGRAPSPELAAQGTSVDAEAPCGSGLIPANAIEHAQGVLALDLLKRHLCLAERPPEAWRPHGVPQVANVDDSLRTQDHEAFDRVCQLPHVSRPGIAAQDVESLSTDLLGAKPA